MGLLLRKHWAEYFTIITTGLFIPLEIYELVRHFTVTKAGGDSDQRPDRLVPGGARSIALKKIFQIVSIRRAAVRLSGERQGGRWSTYY